MALWAVVRHADEGRARGGVAGAARGAEGVSVKPEDVRREILRLETQRLRLAPEVMGGNREALEEDERLERRIMELAGTEREARADELREAWRKRHPGGDEA